MRKKVFCEYLLPIIFGMCVLGFLTYYKFKFGIRLMESDSASDIFYAHLLATEGNIISNNWYFSTELRFMDNELLFAFLFRLFPKLSWWGIETLGTAIMNGCMGVASVILAYELKMGHKSLWMFGFSLLPYGLDEYYYALMHGCGYYVFSIIEVFIILSLFLTIINRGVKHRFWSVGSVVCFLGISFLIGVQGVRLLANLYAPLLLSGVSLYLYGIRQDEKECKCQDMKQRKKIFVFASAGACMALMGYAINKLILSRIYIWTHNENLQWKLFSFEPVSSFINEILSNLGFMGGADLFSIGGLISLLGIAIFMFCFFSLVNTCKKGEIFQQDKFIVFFFIMALALHLFIYIFLQKEYKARYMLPFFMLLPHVICLVLKDWRPNIRQITISILGLCAVVVSINVAYHWHFRGNHQGIDIAKQKEMADFLVDNGYQYGFSTFWYCNSTIQLSNGQLEICPLFSTDVFDKFQWLCTKDEIDYAFNDKVFFIVSDAQLEAGNDKSWNQEEKIMWHDGGICVFAYSSVEELQNAVRN